VNPQGPSEGAPSATTTPSNSPPKSAAAELPEEYIWRFQLDGSGGAGKYRDPLVEMIRVFLDDFLNLGFLTCNGERVQVTGFAFNNKPTEVYDIFSNRAVTNGDQHERLTPLTLESPGTVEKPNL